MRCHPAAVVPIVLLTAALAAAQVTHVSYVPIVGDDPDDSWGIAVAVAGDVNNDGHDDYVVGASSDDTNAASSGAARVYCGRTGLVLYTWLGTGANEAFGRSVDGAGDVNNDNHDDVIVGAPGFNSSAGRATIFSGFDGVVLRTFTGPAAGDRLGEAVAGAGDVNNDSFDDVIVGCPGDDDNGSTSGTARVYAGTTWVQLWFPKGDSAFDEFGLAVGGAGDVNNDGFDDFIVGAPDDGLMNPNPGSARVFSGQTGLALYTIYGPHGGQFGESVSGAGDVNDDNHDDFIVGSSSGGPMGIGGGYAIVYSGLNGAVLHSFQGDTNGDFLGQSVSGAGDVNADGFADLIVGARFDTLPGPQIGVVRVYCGQTGAPIYTIGGSAQAAAGFGFSVAGAGDFNNDGYADFLLGAPYHNTVGDDDGLVRVYHSVVTGSPHCPGDANNDQIVDFDDIVEVLAEWLSVCP